MNRRKLFELGFATTGAMIASRMAALSCDICKKTQDPFRGLKVGVASYSLRKFSLDEALMMTQKLGVKCITLKDFHLPLKCTTEEATAAHKKVEAAGISLMGCGVVYMENEDAVRQAFSYARNAGMPVIVASPAPELIDLVAALAKENDIRVAIHNHGPTDNRYPSPYDVFKVVEKKDAHLGLCLDVGHTIRIGVDPIKATLDCASRLYDFHIKDVTMATPKGEPIELGKGVIDLTALMKVLLKIKFSGHLALEHEIHPDDPMPGMIESFAYLRGILASI